MGSFCFCFVFWEPHQFFRQPVVEISMINWRLWETAPQCLMPWSFSSLSNRANYNLPNTTSCHIHSALWMCTCVHLHVYIYEHLCAHIYAYHTHTYVYGGDAGFSNKSYGYNCKCGPYGIYPYGTYILKGQRGNSNQAEYLWIWSGDRCNLKHLGYLVQIPHRGPIPDLLMQKLLGVRPRNL